MAGLRALIRPGEAVSLWAISVDSPVQSREFAESVGLSTGAGAAVQFLSDAGHRVIDAYGLADPRYARLPYAGIPYPATYVVGRDRRIAWARVDRDYRERPPPAEIRAALDSLPR